MKTRSSRSLNGLKRKARRRVGRNEAHALLKNRLEGRRERFLVRLRVDIFGHPDGVYARLHALQMELA